MKDRRHNLFVIAAALVGMMLIAWSARLPAPMRRLAFRTKRQGEPDRVPAVGRLRVAEDSGETSFFDGVLTWHNDNSRDGLNPRETILTPGHVAEGFGVVFSFPLDGYAYAQPLYAPQVQIKGYGVKNVVYVATENDSVYAFDADGKTSTPLWRASFIDTAKGISTIPDTWSGCTDIGPAYGITGTPVIDPLSGTLYVVAATLNAKNGSQSLSLHALDVRSGDELPGSPQVISASYAGVTFEAGSENSRPGLLLANGQIYIGFGSHCDIQPYNGWLMAYDASTLEQTAVWNVTPAGTEGGIWQSGGGLSANGNGDVYAATGNGTFDHNTGGPDFADSLVRLDPALKLVGYFAPSNQGLLAESDLDIGSGYVLLLPNQPGPHPHEALMAGKGPALYLLDRDDLGGYNPNNDDRIVQIIPHAFPGGIFGGAAYFNGSVYFGPTGGALTQYTLSQGLLLIPPISNPISPPYPGATPSISSDGDANGIVWWTLDKTTHMALHAAMASDIRNDIYDSGASVTDHGVKFTIPTIANGRVYVGTQSNLLVFGLTAR